MQRIGESKCRCKEGSIVVIAALSSKIGIMCNTAR